MLELRRPTVGPLWVAKNHYFTANKYLSHLATFHVAYSHELLSTTAFQLKTSYNYKTFEIILIIL